MISNIINKSHFTISELARKHEASPKRISDLFYQRKLDDRRCPIVSGRRYIPADYVDELEAILRDLGVIQAK